MTHGYIWLPFNLNAVDKQYLFCEAWSDGYISYVGQNLLVSTNHVKEITELSTLFPGSPFFYQPATNTYVAKEEDYLIEGYTDADTLDEDQLTSAEETLEYVKNNDIASAFQTGFAKIPFEEKLELDLGINAEVVSYEAALKQFIGEAQELPTVEVVAKIIENYNNKKDFRDLYGTTYLWKEGQFLTSLYIDSSEYIVPLIIPVALSDHGTYVQEWDNVIAYLKNITEADKRSVILLRDQFKNNNLPDNVLFGGLATELINSW